jgi:hypothetical protein
MGRDVAVPLSWCRAAAVIDGQVLEVAAARGRGQTGVRQEERALRSVVSRARVVETSESWSSVPALPSSPTLMTL